MEQYQYKNILVRYTNDSIKRYSNISNFVEEDEAGFVEFDSTHDMRYVFPGHVPVTSHVRTKAEVVERVQ